MNSRNEVFDPPLIVVLIVAAMFFVLMATALSYWFTTLHRLNDHRDTICVLAAEQGLDGPADCAQRPHQRIKHLEAELATARAEAAK